MGIDHELIAKQTMKWVSDIVVKYNICPFAKKELERKTIHCQVLTGCDLALLLEQVNVELIRLDQAADIATTLIVMPELSHSFDAFLDLIDYANDLLELQEYQGIYQLAHMHPLYCFADINAQDAANFTNRSPYPILHIIREDDISRALKLFPFPETIPARNIALLRDKGVAEIKIELAACFDVDK